MSCLVTVGSTSFDALIEQIFQPEVIEALTKIGIYHVTIQNGSGRIPEFFDKSLIDSNIWEASIEGVKFQMFRYKRSLNDDFYGIFRQSSGEKLITEAENQHPSVFLGTGADYKFHRLRFCQYADLILGHAGAGTCLEVLEMNKPFIAVVNSSLMDNHQSELAVKLAEYGYLLFTTPEELKTTLCDPHLFKLKQFEKSDLMIFRKFLEQQICLL